MATSVRPDRVTFTFDDLMTEDAYEEPLIAGGVRCHGGYIDGVYVSPRSAVRRDAIRNWRNQLGAAGQPRVVVPDKYVPPNYPNYEQARFLLLEGITEPVTRALTIISIVEGFGARIREVRTPDFEREIVEPIEATALAHLDGGLFEAHARDEAGHRDQGGHKQMWEAARDLGLDKPQIPNDVLLRLMSGSRSARSRAYPKLSERMEAMIVTMANVLIIETFADDTFNWAKRLLGDPEVSADAEGAAHLIDCVARDEVPHVDYLSVALSELRARTLCAPDGSYQVSGAEVVDRIFAEQLRGMATERPRQSRERLRDEIRQVIADQSRAATIARRFEDLDAGWTFPHRDDEQLDVLLTPA